MATFRVGIGSFNINDGAVGIGTEGTGHGNLKVKGVIKSTDLDVLGVSTFTRYSGFSADKVNINNRDLTLSGEYSTTGDIVVEDGASLTVGLGSTACVGSVECISVKHHFSVPVGDTAQRNETSGYGEGTIRYNRDFETMEFFNGSEWRQFTYISDIQNSPSSRGRGLLGGGQGPAPTYTDNIGFIHIPTFGDSQNFGDLTQATTRRGCSSSIRGLFGGGFVSPTGTNVMDYVTIASEGNAIDFGDMTHQRRNHAAVSSSTRGIWSGGESPATINVMDFIEISTLGNSLDFGDLMRIRKGHMGINSAVRGIWVASQESGAGTAEAEVITIASKGNSARFGAFSDGPRSNGGAASNPVKGIYAGGYTGSGTRTTQVFSCTIASEGNFINFTDLPEAHDCGQGMSNSTRGVFMGGYPNTSTNTMKSVEFASGGESVLFGKDLAANRNANSAGISDSHGGLGGF